MSPRDALKRVTSGLVVPDSLARPQPGIQSEPNSPQNRLAQIMAEVAATPVEDFFPREAVGSRRSPSSVLAWFALSDVFAFAASFLCAWVLAALANVLVLDRSFPLTMGPDEYVQAFQFAFVAVGVLLWFFHNGSYRRRVTFWHETQKVISAMMSAMVVHGFMQFASKQDFSRLWLVSGWVVAAFAILFFRGVVRNVLRHTGKWQVRTLLVGGGPVADEARIALRSENGLGYEVVMQIENLPLLLDRAEGSWLRLCNRFNADYVVIALEGTALVQADEAIASLVRAGIPFSVSLPLRHVPVLGMSGQYFFSHDTILMSPRNNLDQLLPRFMKRSLDILASGLALVLLSPLLLFLGVIVKRDGGPALFGDVRVGMNGKAFHCLKFRSMIVNGDAVFKKFLDENPDKKKEWDTYHKLKDGDPRVTKIGQFMREWSLDELPQLWNVFIGDMSLVGPRPIMFRERGGYSSDLAHYSRVRPGLTGLWQVSGRSDVSFSRRVQMDSWYVRNWSFWHDVAIIMKTIPVILKKTGAY